MLKTTETSAYERFLLKLPQLKFSVVDYDVVVCPWPNVTRRAGWLRLDRYTKGFNFCIARIEIHFFKKV